MNNLNNKNKFINNGLDDLIDESIKNIEPNNHLKELNKSSNIDIINTKMNRSQTLNPNDYNTESIVVPIIPNIKRKKKIKKHIQIYLNDRTTPYLAAFMKKNKLGKSEAINYILKEYFKIKD